MNRFNLLDPMLKMIHADGFIDCFITVVSLQDFSQKPNHKRLSDTASFQF